MQRSPAVRARGITKVFGDVVALDGVDLDVTNGQVHGLVGPNGAGKTTLLGLLLGLAIADGGSLEIEWRGADDHVLLTGPVATSFSGTLDPSLLG